MPADMAALRALGLTEYGARAYRALVSLGTAGAALVASAGPIPRTRVYGVLADLVRRGWAESEGGRPRRYRARPPAECFARERARIDGLLDAALPALEALHRERSTRFGGPLWIIEGEEAVAQRTLEMLAKARSEAVLVASYPLPGDEKALASAVRAALRRDVRVRVAVPDLDAPHAKALARAGAQMRTVPRIPPRLLFVDGREGMVALRLPRPGGGHHVKAIWNPAPELMEMMGGAALGLWEQAAPAAEAAGPGSRAGALREGAPGARAPAPRRARSPGAARP